MTHTRSHADSSSTQYQHFFVDPFVLDDTDIGFSAAQAHQITRVLRLRRGERVVVLDGLGGEWIVEIRFEGRQVRGTIVERSARCSEPSLHVTVYQSVIRPDHLAWLLQKGTEIGVSRFVMLRTARSQRGRSSPGREERWHAILREAAEQSRRLLIPELGTTCTLAEAVGDVGKMVRGAADSLGILLWERPGGERLTESVRCKIGASGAAHIFVGPEGGWTEDEVALAATAGLEVLSLGPRLLRAETAALVAAMGLLSLHNDLL